MADLSKLASFQRDEGITDKNWLQQKVSYLACEQPFVNEPSLVDEDVAHSKEERRYYALGVTDRERYLFIVFTVRGDQIRVISARNMNKKVRGCTLVADARIPKFNSEEEEIAFWSDSDSTEYIGWKSAQKARFPNRKPSTKTISIRFPDSLFAELIILANKRDIPYQSLLKIFVAEKVEDEIRGR